jgi:hypothetical protein
VSKKIKKERRPGNAIGIRLPPSKPEGISFSFKYFQPDHTKFRCHDQATNYWLTLLDRLKALSGLTTLEMLNSRSSALRCHPIRWTDTTETSFGIASEEQLVDTPYQFSLSSNAHGRVHGFFIDQVFYIVWLDPEHRLYA